jgi:glycine cleavage system H protein
VTVESISGFEVRTDFAYDMDTHMWVDVQSPDCVRVGMDPLGLETSGTLAQLQFVGVGAAVKRNADIGSLEAEKFVGPLLSPLSGTIIAVNQAAAELPSLVERDPFEDGWMIELAPTDLTEELSELTSGRDDIVAEFTRKVIEYRRDGVLAE